jgi:hypothetical protein
MVSIASASAEAQIRFTLDESEPTGTSPLYRAPFEVKETTVVRAKAFKGGQESHVTNQLVDILAWHEAAQIQNAVNGLDYTYYENGDWSGFPDLASLTPVKTGTVENVGIGPAAVDAGYGLKFMGFVRVPEDGIYTFYGRSTELSRLAVDDATLVMTQSRKREKSARIALKAGLHSIEMSAYFRAEDEKRTLEMSYEGPGVPKQAIPSSALFRVEPQPGKG